MQINEEYKTIECIEKMTEQYKTAFFEIVSYYAPKLPSTLCFDGSIYTLHDFNNHCINIYKIISEIILYPPEAYNEKGISSKELYILNLAVLFHDIGMSADLNSARENHSRRSSEYIEEKYHENDSVLRTKSGLNENEIKALRLIVMAHSDLKDPKIGPAENGLNNPQLRNDLSAQAHGIIRAQFLASILRLADELDVTVERLGNNDTEFRLDKAIQKKDELERGLEKCTDDGLEKYLKGELDKVETYIISEKHWKRLHLFSTISKKSRDSDKVYINVNDDYIQRMCERGDTYDHLVNEMLEVISKINKELQNGLLKKVKESRDKRKLQSMISIETVTLLSDIDDINKLIAKKMNCDSVNENERKEENDDIECENQDIHLHVIDEDYAQELSEIINRRHLLKVGHFLLDDTYCARDWIDTKEIIETSVIMDKIIENITKDINTKYNNKSDYLIIGLDFEGAILAARVAMALQAPFSYLIPAKEIENNADKDIEIVMEKYEKFIIITDAIVTFETIKRVINSIGLGDKYEKIMRIYTIFYRESNMIEKRENKELINKTSCISDKFGAELFEKKKCVYKEKKCLGTNRIIK